MKKLLSFAVVMVFVVLSAGVAFAGFSLFSNGDFEAGALTGWGSGGDAAVVDATVGNNVISGLFSAAITNSGVGIVSDTPAVGGVCSFIQSGLVFPTHVLSTVTASFKVRYKTNESTSPLAAWDPFNARILNGLGTINVLSIDSSGITFTPPKTSVKRLDTNTFLPGPPTRPPFFPGTLFDDETPTLLATTTFAYSGCDPVAIEFDICHSRDAEVDSAAFIDDVVINVVSTVNSTFNNPRLNPAPCPPLGMNGKQAH